jgi:hypothetical protein
MASRCANLCLGDTLIYNENVSYFFKKQYHESNITGITSPYFRCPAGDNVCEAWPAAGDARTPSLPPSSAPSHRDTAFNRACNVA